MTYDSRVYLIHSSSCVFSLKVASSKQSKIQIGVAGWFEESNAGVDACDGADTLENGSRMDVGCFRR